VRQLAEYQDRYDFLDIRRDDGVLEVRMHTGGGPMRWSHHEHQWLPMAFADIAADPVNQVVILTGTGEEFIDRVGDGTALLPDPEDVAPSGWNAHDRLCWEAERLLQSYLDIPVPVIAAVNGPARLHGEIALLADIIIATDDAVFGDHAQFPTDLVPGDGVHVIWPMLLGPNRARYFFLTGQEFSAQQALDLGLIGEVVPRHELLPRARELAGQLLTRSRLTLRYTRALLIRSIRKALHDELGFGLALEGVARAAANAEARRSGGLTPGPASRRSG
jgi:enoyl-CoA hydratase/carnithine racemase